MTARGFGKRNDENTQSNYGRENEIESKKKIKNNKSEENSKTFFSYSTEQDMINDYGMADEKVQRSFLYPYFQDLLKLPKFSDSSVSSAPIKNHRLQLRDGTLKFRLNDGNLRIGRGFGKRSFFVDSLADDRNRLVPVICSNEII